MATGFQLSCSDFDEIQYFTQVRYAVLQYQYNFWPNALPDVCIGCQRLIYKPHTQSIMNFATNS